MPPRFKYISEKILLIQHMIKEERGSALVMVLFIVLIFTILGTAVLSATIGGATRATTRENDVQSLHLTEKSLDEAAAYITSQLNGLKDIHPEQLENTIKDYLAVLNLKNSDLNVNTDFSAATGKIKSITYDRMDSQLDKHAINYYITITGEAIVNGVKREMKRELIIDTYPDFLKYALGSGGGVINGNTDVKGNLVINGAASIQGNIYAGNELVIRKTANYVYNKNLFNKSTLYPVLTGEAHVQSLDHVFYSESSSSNDKPVKNKGIDTSEEAIQVKNRFQEILGLNSLDKVVIKNKSKFVEINVDESFVDKVVEAALPNASPSERNSERNTIRGKFSEIGTSLIEWIGKEPPYVSVFEQLEKPIKPTKPTEPSYPVVETEENLNKYKELLTIFEEEMRIYEIELAKYEAKLEKVLNRSGSAIFNGNMLVDNLEYKGITFTESAKASSKWFIVKGNLTIDNFEEATLNIRGNILVTGNVTIRGNVSFDSTMFVLGKTTVEDAVISGLDGKELVLISKGPILINRYDKFSDTPVDLKGFFYTEGSAELYGVGSIFRLHGGFFANGELTINAVLGKVKDGPMELAIDPQEGMGQMRRFEVIYDPDIYKHQMAGLPRVQQVNVRVGPIQLVSNSGN
ncbi:pilus assembly PilX N-terminal domain-containing protein [Paenibacillus glacialis]|uniref:Type 4 fimbrial biogenesis protein PilX N-terminal domain-containing protein n=1 Tax=Paenibacillus glacialis TaxID=494026 RepID=A0A162KAJ9_9BACL|nr:pilus assembly PilX N-terminal domain-containing protein [Paenibacillus glacialis]OAB42958.1 hypothetical protein PGLA_10915 [Paenibacillus glacialis]